jgi:hypothetical protein
VHRSVGPGGLVDLVFDHGSGRREQRDEVGLALLPGVVQAQGRGGVGIDRLTGADHVDVGVVDEHLGDLDRFGGGVPDGQLDGARGERGLFDDELSGRRVGAFGHAPACEHGKSQRGDEEQGRDEPECPGRRLGLQRHQSTTSKKPIQPSSANSVLCAWNMNRPGFGNRSSQIPRWPWACTTVSVYSAGSRRVPVG